MGVKVTSAKSDGKKVSVSFETLKTGESQNMEADYVLVATGRRPFSEGVRLDAVGIEKDQRGFVKFG